MNAPDSPTSGQLREELSARLDGVRASTDLTGPAIAQAADIRHRRRRITAASAAVATLVVASPFVWWAGRGSENSPVPATSTRSASTSTAPTTTVPTTTGTTGTSATSAATSVPAVATPSNTYALDDTIRIGDRVINLEKGTVVERLAVLSNGGFVLQSHMTAGASSSEMELLSPDGRVIKALGMSGFYVVSRDGTRVLMKNGQASTLVVLEPDGTVVGQRDDPRDPAAVVGEYAYLNGPESSLEWNLRTGETRTLPGHLVAVSEDRTRGALRWEVDSAEGMAPGCWAVVDLTSASFTKLIERCGEKDNPMYFMPGSFSSNGTYLVGENSIGGGYWFSAGVVRVDDGTMVVGDQHNASGWTWRLEEDEQTLLISRNTSSPLFPTTHNTLQRCTLSMECTEVQPELELNQVGAVPAPRYVVPDSHG